MFQHGESGIKSLCCHFKCWASLFTPGISSCLKCVEERTATYISSGYWFMVMLHRRIVAELFLLFCQSVNWDSILHNFYFLFCQSVNWNSILHNFLSKRFFWLLDVLQWSTNGTCHLFSTVLLTKLAVLVRWNWCLSSSSCHRRWLSSCHPSRLSYIESVLSK